ncbi:MAG: DUF4097 family beta strand repeat-containing protein [Candidatus Aminicenantales bacterium]
MKKITYLPALLFLLFLALPGFSSEKEKSLKLPAEGIRLLFVDAGAGSLKIEGVEGLTSIEVVAEIDVRGVRDSRIDDFLDDHLRLSLEKSGEEAVLKGYFDHSGFHLFDGEGSVDLTVRMPKAMDLEVDDGSGWASVDNLKGEVRIDDGSGDLTVENIEGNLRIDDGSGEIDARNITGDVEIDDGSGEMTIVKVGGTVTVDDGSGGIFIEDVGKDVVLESTGSGSVRTDNVRGRIIK